LYNREPDRQILDELHGNDLLQAKSSISPMAEPHLEVFAVVEVGESKKTVVVPMS
jgi:hypothetical protein